MSYAKSWLNNFGSGCACFVFSGSPGTGKNHLAAAIRNALLAQHKSVLIITVADLMTEFKAGFSDGKTEAQLMKQTLRVDLLVLDEVRVQMYCPCWFFIGSWGYMVSDLLQRVGAIKRNGERS
ncbi:ATP-binding protein [Enterobacter cloacae]|uniref:ATP-binding protein n=1 Tax=Enterobacter cloacae TaxID=550 RepID=UPI002FD6BC18